MTKSLVGDVKQKVHAPGSPIRRSQSSAGLLLKQKYRQNSFIRQNSFKREDSNLSLKAMSKRSVIKREGSTMSMKSLTREDSTLSICSLAEFETLESAASLSNGSPRHTPPGRSNSAIDATAARRASVRQQYSQRGRLGQIGGTDTLVCSIRTVALNRRYSPLC
eukprot:GFUD01101241.1.p1 GENE.GFUD01101241.1~~GFUD01101241.1.p1  ORF type:complete len:192 (-),score=34.61 GFUD01101241.1:82-573(-)